MRISVFRGWRPALFLGLGWIAHGQELSQSNQLHQLQLQVRQMQQTFEQIQQQHRQQLEALQKQIDALQQQLRAAPVVSTVPTAAPPSAGSPPVEPAAAKPAAAQPAAPWSPADPIRLLGNPRNYLNLSFDALMAAGGSTASDVGALEPGGHDPKVRGFTVQNLETVFEGAVDPYFRAQANLIAHIDSEGESHFEVEEAFAETTSLPWNLQVKAGQYLTEFGRLNPTHPHTWAFVDTSLVNARLLGPEGLRNPGARVSWLLPTRFYSELFLSVQNSQGETAWSFRNPGEDGPLYGRRPIERGVSSFSDLLYTPRYAVSFDATDTHTLLLGVSGAFGPNASGPDTATQIYGADFTWKWRSRRHQAGFPFVTWQNEFLWRNYEAGPDEAAGLPAETLRDYGFYSQLSWGFRRGWVAALRGDWVSGDPAAFYPDPDRDTRWRLSPNLTWYPTEYSKIRLQYNYDRREHPGTDHSVWLQLEFLLGAHAAHKF